MDVVKRTYLPVSQGRPSSQLLVDVDKIAHYGMDYQAMRRNQPYNKMDYNLAYRYGFEKDTWRSLHGTMKQDLHFEPIIIRKPDVNNDAYDIKTPHFLNKLDNRIANVSGFEYPAYQIPKVSHKSQRQY